MREASFAVLSLWHSIRCTDNCVSRSASVSREALPAGRNRRTATVNTGPEGAVFGLEFGDVGCRLSDPVAERGRVPPRDADEFAE